MKNLAPLLIVAAAKADLDALAASARDVQAAGHVEAIELRAADIPEPVYDITL